MNTKELILKQAHLKGVVRTSQIVKLTGLSRQTIAEHFRTLIKEKKLIKIGSTHNAKYVFPTRTNIFPNEEAKFVKEYIVKGLKEDEVFEDILLKINLSKKISDNVFKIVNYTFTEMLNNAIDHSKSKKVTVQARCKQGNFYFQVIDYGIGVYESVRKKFKLKDHFEAVEHLLKGKQTTDPKHHSGQGIFFTSKIADSFVLESAGIKLIIDNEIKDTILGEIRSLKGTKVTFNLKQRSRKILKELFDAYSGIDYEFDKTKLAVNVTLSSKESEYVSRSEAKRLLFGLEKFKRIVLDFKGVKGIGQGFADEIFRVFKSLHPKIKIEAINMNKSVEFMIKRAMH